jgi:N-acetylglucosaminyl-diphospho-decaprenol L-rhamnosyltransferase
MSAVTPPTAPEPSGAVELSVMMICFNGAPKVSRFLPCIAEALAASDINGEIVFVDNGSVDGTADAARAAVPSAEVITLTPNRGSSGARNAAARAAKGRWLLLCDDDVELTAECLRTLWDARDPSRCMIPQVRDLRGALQNSVTAEWRWGDLKLVTHAEPVPTVAYPMAACMLLTKDLYWSVGGFDERFQPNCYEDTAFGFALAERGADVVMVSEATITHFVHGTEETGLALRSVDDHMHEYRERIYRNRWLFDLLVLKGWRRWLTVALGLPRSALESWRTRSVGPARGYCLGWKAFLRDRMLADRAGA